MKAKGYISFWSPPPEIREKFIREAALEFLAEEDQFCLEGKCE